MSTVFISYRQMSDDHRQRVREFGERLRDCGIDVVLDQLFLDAYPGGPDDGWDKWSSDRALKTEYVIIVGTEAWFQCFEKSQPPGTGLGAACEADDLRHRIHEAGGVIPNIRIVLFDDSDAAFIPAKLKRYHHFHAERDFANVARWLGGAAPGAAISTSDFTPHTLIPHNLAAPAAEILHRLGVDEQSQTGDRRVNETSPAARRQTAVYHNLPPLQPFFGRRDELRKIAEALEPQTNTWGILIDGPGGMGKTSLAIQAAHEANSGLFDKIVFISLKTRELDDSGVRTRSELVVNRFTRWVGEWLEKIIPFEHKHLPKLFAGLASQLGRSKFRKPHDEEGRHLLLEVLRSTRTLLIIDNLESLNQVERDIVFGFVKRLPPECKAILTSRGRMGSGADELILQTLDEEASFETLERLAKTNAALARVGRAGFLLLIRETGGIPLLLRWTAGQIGRGHCITAEDAIAYLHSCPRGNDPLEFIFSDLIKDLSQIEVLALAAIVQFTEPETEAHISFKAACSPDDLHRALRSLVNRSLVVPNEELTTFAVVPLAAKFLARTRLPYA